MSSKKRSRLVFLDFETGGVKRGACAADHVAITEIGLVVVEPDTFAVVDDYASYIKPNYDKKLEYQDKALEITRLSLEQLEADGEDVITVASQVGKILSEAQTSAKNFGQTRPILVGHNLAYDLPFLIALMKHAPKYELDKLVRGSYMNDGRFQPEYIDTMSLSYLHTSSYQGISHSLEALSMRMGVDYVDAHGALNDCYITLEVMKKLAGRFRSGEAKGVTEGNVFRKQFKFA